jgi:pilus assembly protein FimV
MNKKLRKLILPVSLLVASQSYGLGLGGLQVNSALDEVLKGKILFILDGTEEIEKIKVSVASVEDYQRVGLDKSYVPSNIQVDVVQQEGAQPYIEISSKGTVSEPIVSLLLVVDWANGHLLREYTLLLDPPIYASTPEQNYSEPVQTQTYESPQIIEGDKEDVTQVDSNSSYRQSNQVVVESGDTLWKIANNVNQGSQSIQQTMVAIFNNNPNAFQNNNMNFLKKGATLTIPDSDQVAMVSNGQAEAEVKSAIQSWSRLQSQDEENDVSSNSDVDYGIELVPPSEIDSSAENNSTSSATARINQRTKAELNQAQEELASSDLENSELSSRVAELEQIVEDQKLALSLKDNNLAQLQGQLSDEESAQIDAQEKQAMQEDITSVDNGSENETDNTSDDVWDDVSDEDSLVEGLDVNTDDLVNDESSQLDEVVDSSASNDEMLDDSQAQNESDTLQVTEVEPVEEKQAVQTSPANEKSLMDKVLAYKYEGLIGLGVLLLGFLGVTYFKRKRDNDDQSDSGGFLDSISNENSDDELSLESSVEENVDDLLEDIDDSLDLSEDEIDLSIDDTDLSKDDLDLDIDDINLDELDEDSPDVNLDEGHLEEDEITELTDLDFDNITLNDEGEIDGLENDSDDTDTLSENDDELTLDLDLDIDDLDDDFEEKESTEQNLEDDLGLDLTMSEEDQELGNVVDDSDDLEEMVFDTGERSIIVDEADADDLEEEQLEFDLEEDMFSTDDLELDFDENEDNNKTELSIEALNLDDIPLSEDESDNTELNLQPIDPADLDDEGEVDIGLDFDDMVDDDGIDTKLDLAKAYFEMGDNTGASQMVTEILEEGNDEQKAKAQELKNEIESS